MRHTIRSRLDSAAGAMGSAVLDRAILALNHLLAAEPAAVARLRPHAGRQVVVDAEPLPAWWPWREPVQLRITPAGLVERADAQASETPARNVAGDPIERPATGDMPGAVGASVASGSAGWPLRATVLLDGPLQMGRAALNGQRPDLRIDGDAAFAADLQWVVANLRWDAADDIERFFGPGAAAAATAAFNAMRGGVVRAGDALSSAFGRRGDAPADRPARPDPDSGRRS